MVLFHECLLEHIVSLNSICILSMDYVYFLNDLMGICNLLILLADCVLLLLGYLSKSIAAQVLLFIHQRYLRYSLDLLTVFYFLQLQPF